MPFSISKGNGSTTVLTSPAKRRVVHELMNTLCFVIFLFLKMEIKSHQDRAPSRTWRLLSECRSSHRTWSSSSRRVHMSPNMETRVSTRPCPSLWRGKRKSNTMSDASSAKELETLHTAMKVHQRLYRSEHKSVAGAPRQAFRNTLQSLNAAYLTS